MKRHYMDITVFASRNMEKDGNADNQYWFDKTQEERLAAAATMIAVAFSESEFLKKKIDRSIFSTRKQAL